MKTSQTPSSLYPLKNLKCVHMYVCEIYYVFTDEVIDAK